MVRPPPRRLELVHTRPQLELAEFSAADYIQLACAGRRTLRVDVVEVGVIDIVSGELWNAEDEHGEGLDALIRILIRGGLSGAALARCYRLDASGPRKLEIDAGGALLEAARQCDEKARAERRVQPRRETEPSESRLSDAALGVEALLRRDYSAALALFRRAQASGDESSIVLGNLQRLAEMGFETDGS